MFPLPASPIVEFAMSPKCDDRNSFVIIRMSCLPRRLIPVKLRSQLVTAICLWAAIILYLDQILMANTTVQLTAEELASMPDNGKRCELVDGVLHMMSPAGGRHGRIAGKLLLRVGNHVERQQLGATFAAETGFLLHRNPDTVRAPDVAFVSHERLGEFADHDGFLPLAPDLVAEVVSPSDQSSEVESKATAWLQAGVRVVLVVDPQTNSIREYRSPAQIQVYRDGAIDLGDILAEFQLDVAELFG